MENSITKIDAVRSLFGRDSYDICKGDGYVKWKDGHTTTAEEDSAIDAEQTRLQALDDYQAPRKAEYPSIGDQLDSLFHAGVFPDDMTAILQAVKDKYPKE